MEEYRSKVASTLRELSEESLNSVSPSWIEKSETPTTNSELNGDANFFNHSGFLHLESFCSLEECSKMKLEMVEMVDREWDVGSGPVDSFGTGDTENTKRGDYFLESSDKVHFFAEPSALNEDGSLKGIYRESKVTALNKVGHALHALKGSSFHSYCFSSKVKALVRSLGWKEPVVPQSMYIFKGRKTGGVVSSHQDSTFLFTEPKQTCLGLWLALDDATLENGCLWVRPKSHREPVRRHFQRNPDHFGATSIATLSNECLGDASQPKLRMETVSDQGLDAAPWEGSVPNDLLDAGFIPIECHAGDLLAFCGETDHLSLANASDFSRHTFQLHIVDACDSQWSRYNWLQYPDKKSFAPL